MATEQDELVMALLMAATATASSAAGAILMYGERFNKTAKNTSSLSGQDWIDDLLTGHDEQFYNEFGLRKHVFKNLLSVLSRDASLHGTRYVSAAEDLCIFLQYARRSLSNRALQEQFQRSGDTIMKQVYPLISKGRCVTIHSIYRCIHHVLDALTSEVVYRAYIRLPTHETPVHDLIRQSKSFWPYFEGCLGALDGTHIPAHVPEAKHISYRNRKGHLSQNVLAACDMGLNFVYILPGWEGSACDSRVFENARISDFEIPAGRYYLADAGYAGSDALLVPYRSIRYHLKEWGQVNAR